MLWSRVSPELDLILDKPTSAWSIDQEQMADTWNVRVGGRWPGTSVADLAAFLEDNPISSPRDVARSVLRDFDAWVGIRKTMKTMKTEVCAEVDVGDAEESGSAVLSTDPSTAAGNTTVALRPRFLETDLGVTTGDHRDFQQSTSTTYVPWLGRIFEGIERRKLSCMQPKDTTLTTCRSSQSTLREVGTLCGTPRKRFCTRVRTAHVM